MKTFKRFAFLLLALMIIPISLVTPTFAAGENYIPGYFGWIGSDTQIPETIANGDTITVSFDSYSDPQAWDCLFSTRIRFGFDDYTDFIELSNVRAEDEKFRPIYDPATFELILDLDFNEVSYDATTGYAGKIILTFIVKDADALKEIIQSSSGKKLSVSMSYVLNTSNVGDPFEDAAYLKKDYISLTDCTEIWSLTERNHTKFVPATIRIEGINVDTYAINYNGNGGSGFVSSQTVEIGEPVTIAQNTFQKGTATFTSWNTRADGNGTSYTSGQSVTDLAGANDSITLYAQWQGGETPSGGNGGGGGGGGGTTAERATLYYEVNGGTKVTARPVTVGDTVNLVQETSKSGYAFLGWYIDKEFTGSRVRVIIIEGDTTLYAKWGTDEELAARDAAEAAENNKKDDEPKQTSPLTQDMLNKSDHFAYVGGYPEGDVRPENNITRAEVSMIFYRLLKEDTRNYAYTENSFFSDVLLGDWHNAAIATMTNLGILNGDGDGAFRPDDFITRAEFAAIAARFDSDVYRGENKFDDLSGHWAAEPVNRAADKGWATGYEDGTFKPEQYIIRAEAMTLINRVLERDKVGEMLDDMVHWPDNPPGAWYYTAVQEATNSHEFERNADGYETWTQLK